MAGRNDRIPPPRRRRPAPIRAWCVAAAILLPATLVAAGPRAGLGPVDAVEVDDYATTHVVVKLRPGVRVVDTAAGRTIRGAASRDAGAIDAELARWGTLDIRAAMRHTAGDLELAHELGLDRYRVVEVPPGTDTATLAATLRTHGDLFEHAEVDGIGGIAAVPNDPAFVLQYGLANSGQSIQGQPGIIGADIGATAAWDLTTGSGDVVLAVLDTGLHDHVEFTGRTVPGYDSVTGTGDTSDNCISHGTHVAGIAAGKGNNSTGIAGIDWNVTIMPVRVLDECTGSEANLADGIIWAVDHGADVINMSLQYSVGSDLLYQAVRYAYRSNVVMVAAAGNDDFSGGVAWPARWCEVIAVAGTDNRDEHRSWSNVGSELDVAAPGQDIFSCIGTNSYGYRLGTSEAAPFVSGAVTLMLSVDPTLSVEEIRTTLTQTAVDVESPGFDALTGWGRIDAAAAVQRTFIEALGPDQDIDGDGAVDMDDVALVIMAWGACDPTETCEPCPEDRNRDFVVDIDDLVAVILGWTG